MSQREQQPQSQADSKVRPLEQVQQEDSIAPTNKKQRFNTTTLLQSPFVSLESQPLDPIYIVEWLGNDLPLKPLSGFTINTNPPTPLKLPVTTGSNPPNPTTPSPSSTQPTPITTTIDQTTYNTPSDFYPCLHVDKIMAVHTKTLPRDILPGQFLIDITQQHTGRIVLAVQFKIEEIPNAQPNTENQTDLMSKKPTIDVTVLGCAAGLFIQFWSRRANAEFKMRRILNIFSIFVDQTVGSRGLGSGLMDGLVYLFEPVVLLNDIDQQQWFLGATTIPLESDRTEINSDETEDEKKSRTKIFDEISLEVRSSNTKAIAFYKSRGFTIENTENGYYPHGVTAADRRMHEMCVDFWNYNYSNPSLIHKLKESSEATRK